jgi:hypothetical protein
LDLDPLDTLATLSSPHPLPYEHWLSRSRGRDQDKALNIADRIRRHRFYATQPLGGRLLALRWILEAPAESLGQHALSQRQELLVRYPKYGDLSRRAGEVRAKAVALPVAPANEAEGKQQHELLAELGKLSAAQEAMLQVMSLAACRRSWPFRPGETKEIQQQLPEGTLVFIWRRRHVYGFALSRDRYGYFGCRSRRR